MSKVVNLQDYRKAELKDMQEIKRIVNSFPFSDKQLEKECNYYLERYIKTIVKIY